MISRTEIMARYTVVNGIIQSPGKFEGLPIYAPYFHAQSLDGIFDDAETVRLRSEIRELGFVPKA